MGTITLEMICDTGKSPSPLPKSSNNSTSEYSNQRTGFNELSWGEQTHGLVKLIVHKLWPESYDKVIVGAREIVKRTHSSICTEEVIDLTTDEPPDKFAMVTDLPSDEDSEMDVVKNEPENHYRDDDGYNGADGDDVAGYNVEEEEYTRSQLYF